MPRVRLLTYHQTCESLKRTFEEAKFIGAAATSGAPDSVRLRADALALGVERFDQTRHVRTGTLRLRRHSRHHSADLRC